MLPCNLPYAVSSPPLPVTPLHPLPLTLPSFPRPQLRRSCAGRNPRNPHTQPKPPSHHQPTPPFHPPFHPSEESNYPTRMSPAPLQFPHTCSIITHRARRGLPPNGHPCPPSSHEISRKVPSMQTPSASRAHPVTTATATHHPPSPKNNPSNKAPTMSHCDPIWPASTMSQMSHFSNFCDITQLRFHVTV